MENAPKIPKNWTEPEKWVWEQISSGKLADLNKYDTDHKNLAPDNEEGWGKNRCISAKFLQTILTQKTFVEATPFSGVRIFGALIDDAPLNLEHARLQYQLWLEKSRILVDVMCRNLIIDGDLTLDESFIATPIDLYEAHIRGSISLIGAILNEDIFLTTAKIDNNAFLHSNAIFNGALNFVSINIGSNLIMGNSTLHLPRLVTMLYLIVEQPSKPNFL